MESNYTVERLKVNILDLNIYIFFILKRLHLEETQHHSVFCYLWNVLVE